MSNPRWGESTLGFLLTVTVGVGKPLLCHFADFAVHPSCSGQTSRLADEATALGTTGTQSLPRLPVCFGKPYRQGLSGLGAVSSGLFKFPIPNKSLRSGDAYIWIRICPSRL